MFIIRTVSVFVHCVHGCVCVCMHVCVAEAGKEHTYDRHVFGISPQTDVFVGCVGVNRAMRFGPIALHPGIISVFLSLSHSVVIIQQHLRHRLFSYWRHRQQQQQQQQRRHTTPPNAGLAEFREAQIQQQFYINRRFITHKTQER